MGRRGRLLPGRGIHLQFAAQAVQPLLAQIAAAQVAQGIVRILRPGRDQRGQGRDQRAPATINDRVET